MEPKLKKSVVNEIITKQIFVPSTLLLNQIPLLLTKKTILYFGIQLESRQHKKGGEEVDWKSFCFAKIYIITIFVLLQFKFCLNGSFLKVTCK